MAMKHVPSGLHLHVNQRDCHAVSVQNYMNLNVPVISKSLYHAQQNRQRKKVNNRRNSDVTHVYRNSVGGGAQGKKLMIKP